MPPSLLVQQVAQGIAAEQRAQKVLWCINVCDLLLCNDPSSAAEYGYRALWMADALHDKFLAAHSMYRIGLCSVSRALYSDALRYLGEAYAIFNEQCNELMLARVQSCIGQVYAEQNDYTTALHYYNKSLLLLEQLGEAQQIAHVLNSIGSVKNAVGDYGEAAEALVRAVKLWGEEYHSSGLGVSYSTLAVTHAAIGDKEKAVVYGENALSLAMQDGNKGEEAAALLLLGALQAQHGQTEAAMSPIMAALDMFTAIGSKAKMAEAMGCIGDLHERGGRLRDALHCYRQALELAEEIGSKKLYGYNCYHIGNVYCLQEQHVESLALLRRAETILRETGHRLYLSEVYLTLSKVHHVLGNAPQVLHYYKQYHAIREEILGHKQQRAIAAVLSRYEIEKAEQEKELYRLKMNAVEAEIAHRERALTATISAITQKSELLKKLHVRLREILKSRGDRAAMLRSLLQEVRHHMNLKQDWQEFELLFEEVHRHFIQRLSEQFPALSANEIRVCALLKTNLSSKEIARLLSLSERTIATHRHSIRKKLGIGVDSNLVTWLASL